MSSDITDVFAALEGSTSDSIVSKILEIQRKCIENKKSIVWAKNLECLSIIDDKRKILGIGRKPNTGPEDNKYIAVSHAWAYSLIPENSSPGLYRIRSRPGGPTRPCKTRDEVLDRVISYAKHHNITRFWIDIECLDQKDKQKHQTAMDSMDLVYSYSAYPLGLIGTILRSQDEVNLLQDLLSGAFIGKRDPDDRPKLKSSVSENIAIEVLRLLERISSDHWWHRR